MEYGSPTKAHTGCTEAKDFPWFSVIESVVTKQNRCRWGGRLRCGTLGVTYSSQSQKLLD